MTGELTVSMIILFVMLAALVLLLIATKWKLQPIVGVVLLTMYVQHMHTYAYIHTCRRSPECPVVFDIVYKLRGDYYNDYCCTSL